MCSMVNCRLFCDQNDPCGSAELKTKLKFVVLSIAKVVVTSILKAVDQEEVTVSVYESKS